MYAGALIKKRHYCLKIVPGDLFVTQFKDQGVGDVVMLESRTQDNK